jgi:hypothetical protein
MAMPEPYIPLVPTPKVCGRVAAIPKGVWNSTTEYKKLDIVRHELCAYMAKKASINRMPTGVDDEYWMLLVESFISDFIGATESADGHNGMVPKPLAGEEHNVLRGDGDWGPKLEIDVVKQGDLYGYVNSLGDFVAFQSQQDVINIITELLIPEDAQEALDTLKEIADWIQDHPDDAAAMNSRITELEETAYRKTGGLISGNVKIAGELELDNPLAISSGGTGADNDHDARVNLNAFNNENVAPVEEDAISDRDYAVGDHFIFDDVLYNVISPIAVGDEFIVGNDSLRPNVLIIDQVTEASGDVIFSNAGSGEGSDDGSTASSDDEGEDPIPESDIKISTTLKTVRFAGTGNGTERIFAICTNLLDNPLVKRDKPYSFSADSGYSNGGNTIIPRFALYDDDELLTIVDSFDLSVYTDANVVKPVYIYKITGEIDVTLSPEVHILSDYYNCDLSPTIEEQIQNLNQNGVIMTGATESADGSAGFVPGPVAGDNKKFFKGDGNYDKVNVGDEVKGQLPVANGGTGADNEIDAVKNLHAVPDSMVTSNTEYESVASKAYAVGDQLIYNGILYTVIASISKDAAFVVGTNIQASDDLIKQMKEISVVGSRFVGATESTDGEMGLVPKPLAGDQDKVLEGDGNWVYHSRNFVGTMGEWEALTLAEKIKYETADILPEFDVTVVKDEHVDTVTLTPATTDSKYGYGRVVNVTASPVSGYKITSGTGAYTISEDTTITVTSAIRRIELTVNQGENVDSISVSPSSPYGDGTYDYDTVITITATADEHYVISAGTGQYTLTDDLTVNVSAVLEQFTVTINADNGIDNVRLAPSSSNNKYDYGTVITAVVTPKTGYDLISGAGQYTITEDTTITVVSEIQHYTLTASGDEHVTAISFSPSPDANTGKYDYGTVVTVTATFDEHYEVDSGTGEYTITEDTDISITSKLNRFTLTVTPDAHVDSVSLSPVSPYGDNLYDYGTSVIVSASPVTGYDIISGTGAVTITEDTTVSVVSEIQHLTFTATGDSHVASVSVSPAADENGKYDYGTVVTVSAVADTGYDIISGTGQYTVIADTSVSVTSEIQHLSLTLVPDEHVNAVRVSPVSEREDGKYDYGTVVTVTADPETGYDIISGTGTYTITADTTVNVTSEIQHLTLTVTSDEHVDSVNVSPAADQNGKYDYGTVITITATPVTGYDIVGGVGSYTITEDTTVAVTSEIQHLTLTIVKDSNVDTVTLSPQPDANGYYDYGTVVTVTATAKAGYEILSGPDTYTITSATAATIVSQLAPAKLTSSSAFGIEVVEPGWDGKIYYILGSDYTPGDDNNVWTEWDGSEISCSASDTLYLKGDGNTKLYDGSYDNRFIFTGSAFVANMEVLLDYDTAAAGDHPTMAVGAFHSIFEGNTSLVTPPLLPATTLSEDCYYSMFAGCTSLATAPELPATTMAEYAYAYMFNGCTSLTLPPALPATTLAEGCYDSMFVNCSALTTLPMLPATTLAEDCYEEMFLNCTSIMLASSFSAAYSYEYRIPASSTGTNPGSLRRMFYNTGGTFTGTPVVNVTYYTNNEPIE